MAVYALLIDTLMLPINAPSILTLALRLPPASTTAMSTGYPISTAFASAAEITPFLRLLALCSPYAPPLSWSPAIVSRVATAGPQCPSSTSVSR
jgi:hypothetical protein